MKDTYSKWIELAANISIILVAFLWSVAFFENLLPRSSVGREPIETIGGPAFGKVPLPVSGSPPAAGTKITLPGFDWGVKEQYLLLVLSTRCHFCSESAPFYQRLAKAALARDKINLVAVFPQNTKEAKTYLRQLDLALDIVVQSPLSAIGIRGTPTLLLVDNKGVVRNAWLGRLSPEKEAEVLQLMGP